MDLSHWWRLAGPSRFIGAVVDDLRDGRNVTLCLPEHLPHGLARGVRDELGDCWAWTTLSLDEESARDPVSALYGRFVTDDEPSAIRNARNLATNASISGRIIWIEGMPLNSWAVWKRFLTEYQHACRSRSLLDRGIFCTPLIGELALNPPVEDACLANHSWRGVVDYLDILTYAASVIHRRGSSSVQHRLMVAVVSSLAQWDPRVCDHFADESLERILDPGPSLRELALQRSWPRTQESDGLVNCWHLGMIDNIDKKSVVHSAALAHNDPTSEIARRVWSAEIGVLLPLIEEKRRGFLERYGKVLRVPFQTPFGIITDVRDLEISHIDYQIASCRLAIDPEVRGLIARLRDIRNTLSHLEPVPTSLLQDRSVSFSIIE
jgi:hypothetical protein